MNPQTPLPPIRACIFDLDGLLINSEDIYTDIHNQILKSYSLPPLKWTTKALQQSRGPIVSPLTPLPQKFQTTPHPTIPPALISNPGPRPSHKKHPPPPHHPRPPHRTRPTPHSLQKHQAFTRRPPPPAHSLHRKARRKPSPRILNHILLLLYKNIASTRSKIIFRTSEMFIPR